jgi:hypothetical protein
MTERATKEYRQLELDSSNHMIEWDAHWLAGRYEEATYAIWKAGNERFRMGEMTWKEGQFERAAADWLSSAACYVEATDEKHAVAALARAQELEAQGRISAERTDLFTALRKREEEVRQLRAQIQKLSRALSRSGSPKRGGKERALKDLLQQVRELPGLGLLHEQIARQAAALGRQELADKHRAWAAKFDAANELHADLQTTR